MIATGRLTTYPGRSKYQIVIERMELAGAGALMALLDQRRRALAAEGLFDAARKRPLPFLPRVIGVVTSPTGAVIRDILHRLADRCPTRVLLWPVAVQGEGGGGAGRGGGARVRRDGGGRAGAAPRPASSSRAAAARSRICGRSTRRWWCAPSPTARSRSISAVGHETDTTLCDFAADMRAPTPTAAAEMAVPVRAELLATLARAGRAQRPLRQPLSRARGRAAGGDGAAAADARAAARPAAPAARRSSASGCRARCRAGWRWRAASWRRPRARSGRACSAIGSSRPGGGWRRRASARR